MPGSEYYDRDYDDPVVDYIPTARKEPEYKFNEGEYIKSIKEYINKTYTQHYATGKIQATEMIIDMGDGVGFCRGNVIKYAKRYGQKAGRNKDDLMKVIHYALMMLYVHDQETKGN